MMETVAAVIAAVIAAAMLHYWYQEEHCSINRSVCSSMTLS